MVTLLYLLQHPLLLNLTLVNVLYLFSLRHLVRDAEGIGPRGMRQIPAGSLQHPAVSPAADSS